MHKILFIVLLSNQWANAQQVKYPITYLKDWRSYPLLTNKDSLFAWNHDTTEWTIYTQNGVLYALNTFRPKYRRYLPGDSLPIEVSNRLWENEKKSVHRGYNIMAVEDGFLIGINEGEWGGELVWYSKNGKEHYKISDNPVIQITKKDDKIYAIEGTNHMTISRGSILEITKVNFKWTTKEYLKLPSAPSGFAINSKNKFVVALSDQLIEINNDAKTLPLIEDTSWWGLLGPQSICIVNDVVYIGMRKGIFRYDIKTKEKGWLMRN